MALVDAEIQRLPALAGALNSQKQARGISQGPSVQPGMPSLQDLLSEAQLQAMDLFDQLQLQAVIGVCQRHPSLSEAGRQLFQHSAPSAAW